MMQMKSFWTKLADVPLWLTVRGDYTRGLFEKYIITPTKEEVRQYRALAQEARMEPEQPVQVTDAEIKQELAYQPDVLADFPEEVLEALAMYRKIMDLMQFRNAVMFHSSALEMDDRGYLFAAPSGTGKSTHTRLWRQVFGSRVTMINDDKPLLRLQEDGSWRVYGTPYGGKENIHNNISQKLCGIVLLERGTENRIEPVNAHDAYIKMWRQTYHNDQQPLATLHVMDLVGRLAKLPVYRLQCNISEEAVYTAYNMLKGEPS